MVVSNPAIFAYQYITDCYKSLSIHEKINFKSYLMSPCSCFIGMIKYYQPFNNYASYVSRF